MFCKGNLFTKYIVVYINWTLFLSIQGFNLAFLTDDVYCIIQYILSWVKILLLKIANCSMVFTIFLFLRRFCFLLFTFMIYWIAILIIQMQSDISVFFFLAVNLWIEVPYKNPEFQTWVKLRNYGMSYEPST